MNDRADEIFNAKIKSGKYSHYTDKELASLYMDCLCQAKAEGEFNIR